MAVTSPVWDVQREIADVKKACGEMSEAIGAVLGGYVKKKKDYHWEFTHLFADFPHPAPPDKNRPWGMDELERARQYADIVSGVLGVKKPDSGSIAQGIVQARRYAANGTDDISADINMVGQTYRLVEAMANLVWLEDAQSCALESMGLEGEQRPELILGGSNGFEGSTEVSILQNAGSALSDELLPQIKQLCEHDGDLNQFLRYCEPPCEENVPEYEKFWDLTDEAENCYDQIYKAAQSVQLGLGHIDEAIRRR